MIEKIYASQDWVDEKIVESQADFMQFDNTKPDYIRNAPCKLELGFANSPNFHTGKIENPSYGTTLVIDWTTLDQALINEYMNYDNILSFRHEVTWGSKYYMNVTNESLVSIFQNVDHPVVCSTTSALRKLDDKNFYFACNPVLSWYFIIDPSTLSVENAETFKTKGLYMQLVEFGQFVTSIDFVELDAYGYIRLHPNYLPAQAVLQEDIVSMVSAPTTAEVGQLLSVKAVDENGKPTEWEALDPATIFEEFGFTVDENGTLVGGAVTGGGDSSSGFELVDRTTGEKYNVYVDNGKLTMEVV